MHPLGCGLNQGQGHRTRAQRAWLRRGTYVIRYAKKHGTVVVEKADRIACVNTRKSYTKCSESGRKMKSH